MPGEFGAFEDVRIYQCGTHTDGSAVMCTEVTSGTFKHPIWVTREVNQVGWREAGKDDVHIRLSWLVNLLKQYDITVSYDEEKLRRKLYTPPSTGPG